MDRILREEDEVFAAFSKKVGVKSIREYEEKAKVEAEKLLEQKIELDNRVRTPYTLDCHYFPDVCAYVLYNVFKQESKLRNQLEFLKVHDWTIPVNKLKQKIATDQASITKLQKELASIEQAIDALTAELKAKSDSAAKQQKSLDALVEQFQVIKKEGTFCSALRQQTTDRQIHCVLTTDLLRFDVCSEREIQIVNGR